MSTDDAEIALNCLRLAADIRQLADLDVASRKRVLAEVAGLLDLLVEVFLEDSACPA